MLPSAFTDISQGLSVQNPLGKGPDTGPTLRLLLKVGVGGDLDGEEDGTVSSVIRMINSHLSHCSSPATYVDSG